MARMVPVAKARMAHEWARTSVLTDICRACNVSRVMTPFGDLYRLPLTSRLLTREPQCALAVAPDASPDSPSESAAPRRPE